MRQGAATDIRRGSKFSCQDDYIYSGKSLVAGMVSYEVVNDPVTKELSDHLPVMAESEA